MYTAPAYTTAAAFLEALQAAGVSYIFANFGSDHPGLIEALAQAKAEGRPLPRVVTCPNEMVALSAAHGYAQATGKPQAVFVHVECGTQALAGAVHNAAKGRVPVLIFAGLSPITQEGELRGSRNEFIHWLQDVSDQRGIVRPYMRYDNEIRTGVNVRQMVFRALQFAASDPQGPVYLTCAREILEQEVPRADADPAYWPAIPPSPAPFDFIDALAAALAEVRRPLAVTSSLGRNPAAVAELVRLCETTGMGVLESVPNVVNFPADHHLYLGVQGNEPCQSQVLAQADLVLVVESDVPWIPTVNKPRSGIPVFQIDTDPLKERTPLWQLPARHIARADPATALSQLNARIAPKPPDDHYARIHRARREALRALEAPEGHAITPEFLVARVREHIPPDAIVLNEGITNYKTITEHIGPRPPGSMFTSGGGSLGWNGGAAIGFKLAWPDRMVVAFTGDGSFMFSVPSTVHWMARRYRTPFLQIVLNNGGWRAPRLSTLAVHPDGFASRTQDLGIAFDQPPDYAGIGAAAGGAFAATVKREGDLDAAIAAAVHAVQAEKRAAVIDVWLG